MSLVQYPRAARDDSGPHGPEINVKQSVSWSISHLVVESVGRDLISPPSSSSVQSHEACLPPPASSIRLDDDESARSTCPNSRPRRDVRGHHDDVRSSPRTLTSHRTKDDDETPRSPRPPRRRRRLTRIMAPTGGSMMGRGGRRCPSQMRQAFPVSSSSAAATARHRRCRLTPPPRFLFFFFFPAGEEEEDDDIIE